MVPYTDRSLPYARQYDPTHPIPQRLHNLALQNALGSFHRFALLPRPPFLLAQHRLERSRHNIPVLFQVVDHTVRPRIKRIRGGDPPRLLIHRLHPFNRRPTDIIQIKDGRVRVQTGRMERITLPHRDLGETGEILAGDRRLHLPHRPGHHLRRPGLEHGARLHGRLHAGRAADALLLGRDDEDQGAHFGPVAAGRDEASLAVGAIEEGALIPGHVAAEEGTACGAGALASDEGEFRWRLGELVEICDCADEGGEAGGGRGEASGGGEVIGGGKAEGVG